MAPLVTAGSERVACELKSYQLQRVQFLLKPYRTMLKLHCITSCLGAIFIWFTPAGSQMLSTDIKQFDAKVSECEYSALRLGSRIADVFNAPIGDEGKILQKLIAQECTSISYGQNLHR